MSHQQTKDTLTAQLAELTERLEKLKIDAGSAHPGDSSEMAQERENDEVVDALGNETLEEIHQIQNALARIEEGRYGQCQLCGEAISVQRLQALPAAALCINCA